MEVDFLAVRQFACAVIKKYNLKIPIDLNYLLKKLNIDLERAHLPSRVDGMALSVKFARGLVVVNADRLKTRERFTIAHEIGHILRHYPRIKQKGGLFLEEKNSMFISICEREANIFATELLMPRAEVIAFHQRTKSIQELAGMFQVSKQAMSIRLEELKLISTD